MTKTDTEIHSTLKAQQEFNRNPLNEADTWAQLYQLLPFDDCHTMGLWSMIDNFENSKHTEASKGLKEIADELLKIVELCIQKQGVERLLWPALYKFSKTRLTGFGLVC